MRNKKKTKIHSQTKHSIFSVVFEYKQSLTLIKPNVSFLFYLSILYFDFIMNVLQTKYLNINILLFIANIYVFLYFDFLFCHSGKLFISLVRFFFVDYIKFSAEIIMYPLINTILVFSFTLITFIYFSLLC